MEKTTNVNVEDNEVPTVNWTGNLISIKVAIRDSTVLLGNYGLAKDDMGRAKDKA